MRVTLTCIVTRTASFPAAGVAALVAACGGAPSSQPKLVAGPVPDPAPAASSSATAVDTRGPTSPHPLALARLAEAPWAARVDKRRVVALPLPDGGAWTHVRYWGVTTLAGYRYGDEHHVALAVFSFGPPPGGATVDGCAARFAEWGRARAKAFDVDVGDARVDAIDWPPKAPAAVLGGAPPAAKAPPNEPAASSAKVFVLDAQRRSLLGTKRYAAAYAVYPAWTDACLVVGFAVPERSAAETARAVRDRIVRDALPSLVVKPGAGALALEARSDG